MKKFAFLLALVAVFAMSAGAFAANFTWQVGELAYFTPISTDRNDTVFGENNGFVVNGSTNLYYAGKDAHSPTIAFGYATGTFRNLDVEIAADATTDRGQIFALVNGVTLISSDADFEAVSKDNAFVEHVFTGSADLKGQTRFSQGALIGFPAKDLKSLSNIAIISGDFKDTEKVKVGSLDVTAAKIGLTINPVEIAVTASQYAIVLTSGDKLPWTEVSFDFKIDNGRAVISTDAGGVPGNRYAVDYKPSDRPASSILMTASNDVVAQIRVDYDNKKQFVAFESTNTDDVVRVPGKYSVIVKTANHTVIDETFTGGTKSIDVLGREAGVALATVNLVVLPPATKTATVSAGTLSFEEGNADRSVIIQTDLIDGGGVSNDLVSGLAYVVLEDSKDAIFWGPSDSKFLRVTVNPRQAGTSGGVYYDLEIPKATLDTLKAGDYKLYVASAGDFNGTMKITNALEFTVRTAGGGGGGGGGGPEDVTGTADAGTDLTEATTPAESAINFAALGIELVPGSYKVLGNKVFKVTANFESTTQAQQYVNVSVTPGEAHDADYSVGLMVKDGTTYRVFASMQNVAGIVGPTRVPGSLFTPTVTAAIGEYTADVYAIQYQAKPIEPEPPTTGGGSSGGCEMGFGLAAVAGLAALVLRKRSK